MIWPGAVEIMQLNKLITGKEIWAGRSMTKRVAGADGKLSKVIRLNAPHEDGHPSLGQAEIARWPDALQAELVAHLSASRM